MTIVVNMAARTNSQFLFASLTEFISVWAQNGEASLTLKTSAGITNVQLNCTLGHPGAPHSFPPSSFPPPPPAPPPRRPRHRGPSEQEKNRLRAARHQAARETSPVMSTTSSPVAASSASSSLSVVTVTVTSPTAPADHVHGDLSNCFSCDECDFTSNTDRGVKVHKGHHHKETQKPDEFSDVIPQLDGPAEETLGLTSDKEVIEEDSEKQEMDMSHLPTADDPDSFESFINQLNQEKIENMSEQELIHINA